MAKCINCGKGKGEYPHYSGGFVCNDCLSSYFTCPDCGRLFDRDDFVNGEIIIKGTNKGNAVQKVIEELNIPIEDTICFGDSMNDYEMVQVCHYSVVMGNGDSELKKYATTICESVEEDGVALELKRLGLF